MFIPHIRLGEEIVDYGSYELEYSATDVSKMTREIRVFFGQKRLVQAISDS